MEAQQQAPAQQLPSLSLEEWEDTRDTLHLYFQIVGKIRMALTPKRNHWWHVTLYVNSTGWGTSPIPFENRTFEININMVDHQLEIITSEGDRKSFKLENGLSVKTFYGKLLASLRDLGIRVQIIAEPYGNKSTIPFAEDDVHHSYDPEYASRFWHVVSWVDTVFKEFCGGFKGKCSPVQMFWHSFDLAVTRFSGRKAPEVEGADAVTQEAYSHEVISAGFWPGDIFSLHEPAFYSYTYPLPEGLTDEPLQPPTAKWMEIKGGPMAILTYEDIRKESNPKQALLDFLESTYRAGAKRAGWKVKNF